MHCVKRYKSLRIQNAVKRLHILIMHTLNLADHIIDINNVLQRCKITKKKNFEEHVSKSAFLPQIINKYVLCNKSLSQHHDTAEYFQTLISPIIT